MMKTVYGVAFGIGAFFAMNCGSGETGYPSSATQEPAATESPTQATADAAEVKVDGHSFDPPVVTIKAGQSVKWVWVSGSHNVVSGESCTSDGKFSSGDEASSAPKTFAHTFTAPGSYPYFCDPHCGIGMKGKVVVE